MFSKLRKNIKNQSLAFYTPILLVYYGSLGFSFLGIDGGIELPIEMV